MPDSSTLLLAQVDIARTMALDDYIVAVEQAFRHLAAGEIAVPDVVHLAAPNGAFHVKSAAYTGPPHYVAVKVNGNFPDNARDAGLPTIQGAIVLCDGRNGSLLAVIDSIEVTTMRTGAATAVAAKYLAPRTTSVATIVGCGVQGCVQLLSLLKVLPLTTVYAFDIDAVRARGFIERMRNATGLDVVPADDLGSATRASHVIATCTSSRRAFLEPEHVSPGTFIAAVGADDAEKQELSPELMARAIVVTDLTEQCAGIGDLHHALAAGAMTRADVFAELADVVAGKKPRDFAPDDIVVFDSTGTAIQDLAAAGMIYERASANGAGLEMQFA